MTTDEDLVRRLRDVADDVQTTMEHVLGLGTLPEIAGKKTCAEAADRIEALTSELAEMRKQAIADFGQLQMALEQRDAARNEASRVLASPAPTDEMVEAVKAANSVISSKPQNATFSNSGNALGMISPALTDEWQPIETAPKDGSDILAVTSAGERCIVWWKNGRWLAMEVKLHEMVQVEFDNLTHWMPLPQPPRSRTGEGE